MYGAGKRSTRPPDRYDPAGTPSQPILPATDFDITMGDADDSSSSLLGQNPLSLVTLNQKVQEMADILYKKLEIYASKFCELDSRFEELCTRVDDIDNDITTRLTAVKSDFHDEFLMVHGNIAALKTHNDTAHSTTLNTSLNHVNSVQRSLQTNLNALSDRITNVEAQSARLAALENIAHNSTQISPPSFPHNQTTLTSQVPTVLNNVPFSVTTSNSVPPNCSQSTIVPPQIFHPPNNPTSLIDFSNTTGITLDFTKIPTYDGNLYPMHPEEFLNRVDQYFLMHPIPDQVKINLISEKFIEKAHLWYTTLIPPPSQYQDFLVLFRDQFWSSSLQRSIRNELYRPYIHRDFSNMQEHAMDWISRARYLNPPIEQSEMIEEIISHFSYNVTLALRGLRITTTNELIQQLSSLQRTHAFNHHNNNNSNSNHFNNPSHQNSNNYSHRQQNQNRYPPRPNNQSNSRNPNSPPPNPDEASPGN